MAKVRGKAYQAKSALINRSDFYSATEAVKLVLKTSPVKFDATVEAVFNLNVNPKYPEHQIRGAIVLPSGTGRKVKILALTKQQQAEATAAGADYVGAADLISKIKTEKWFDYDVIVATPEMMPELGRLGSILGPKGYMPNAKLGTLSPNITQAITDLKHGKSNYRIDKTGNIHMPIGKVSFTPAQIQANYDAALGAIKRAKPANVKGNYIKGIALTTTMGPSLRIKVEF